MNTLQTLVRIVLVAAGFMLPALARAQSGKELDFTQVNSITNDLLTFIDVTVVPVIFAIAFLVFIWGVYTYFIAGAAKEEKRDEGKKFVMWGLIGFVIMVSVWGIVNLLTNTLGFNNETRPRLPTFGSQPSQNTQNSATFPAQGNTQNPNNGGSQNEPKPTTPMPYGPQL